MSGFEKNKLSNEDVFDILAGIKSGQSINSLAQKYKVDRGTIYYYKKMGFKKERVVKKVETKKKIKRTTSKGRMYEDYLEEENAKRKEKGWYKIRVMSTKARTRKGL